MGFISPIATNSDGTARQTGSLQSLGKDDFLQLLVAKLQHQDPLDPMQDEDFVAQLAQFSSLEQMNNIADGIASSNEFDFLQSQSLNNTMAAGLIGKDIKATYNGVYLDSENEPVINFTLPEYAETVSIRIVDREGNTVTTLSDSQCLAGTHSITWDGKDQRGNRVEEGYYSVEATGVDPSEKTVSVQLALIGKVETVIYREGMAFLSVDGTEVPLSDVTAIGEEGSFTEADEG